MPQPLAAHGAVEIDHYGYKMRSITEPFGNKAKEWQQTKSFTQHQSASVHQTANCYSSPDKAVLRQILVPISVPITLPVHLN